MSMLSRIKTESESRLTEEKRLQERKRGVLVLIQRYLLDNGYVDSAQRVGHDTNISLEKVDSADNMDLLQIVQEYEDYYDMKFGKKPKLTRKVEVPGKLPRLATDSKVSKKSSDSGKKHRSESKETVSQPEEPELTVVATKVSDNRPKHRPAMAPGDEYYEKRLMKPVPPWYDGELKELAMTITRDICTRNPGVAWSDIVGLDRAKALVVEAVIMPMRYPELFTGILAPWRGILLYGPAGTGKTLLAKAVATECETTFFNISASTIMSKWRGDSEKLVRVLFELATYHGPSTVFLDEIDAIMGHRSSNDEHEGSRRMKTEVLIQMDGLNGDEHAKVFVLAASNLPWDLDSSLLRRLEKRILVDLPCKDARFQMLCVLLGDRVNNIDHLDVVAANTVGWSGSDLRLFCKEAAMLPLRRFLQDLNSGGKMGKVEDEDMNSAFCRVRPSPQLECERYGQWQSSFGAT
eukprot:GEMP01033973.1.p1 GENE.GEMP01033973.1~~GEMP01033973.1.p1  ORF type:complete len:464 (+),score=97.94 GEMP01033973.1:57-1448(+)